MAASKDGREKHQTLHGCFKHKLVPDPAKKMQEKPSMKPVMAATDGVETLYIHPSQALQNAHAK